MNTTKLAAIREIVIKANPEIAERSDYWWCGDHKGEGDDWMRCQVCHSRLTLADVLLAWRDSVEPSIWWNPNVLREIVTSWNLRQDDLSLQQPETIDFIFSLLCHE